MLFRSTSVFAVGSVIGPLIGGFFTEQLSWRWIFIVNIPIGCIALVITTAALRIPFARRDRKVDYLGAALLTGSVTSLILLLSWASEDYGWTSTISVALGALAAVLGVCFYLWEQRAPEPVMPLHLFKIDVIRVTVPMVAFAGTIIYGANAFIPLFLQAVTGVSPTKSGLLLVPIMAGVTTASIGTPPRPAILGSAVGPGQLPVVLLIVIDVLRSRCSQTYRQKIGRAHV